MANAVPDWSCLLYTSTIAEAPARRDEIAYTYEEDIEIRELTNPVSCYSKDGVLTGVKCEKMVLGEPDESGRRRPVGTGEFFDEMCIRDSLHILARDL